MDATVPDLSVTVFGQRFSTPIMTTALSHLKKFNPGFEKPMEAYALGAKQADRLATMNEFTDTDILEITRDDLPKEILAES